MKKLTQLIEALDKGEINLIRRYFLLNRKPENLLRNKLFELLIKDKNINHSKVEEGLKRKLSGSAVRMLINRLEDDILKSLIITQGPQKFKSKYFEAKHNCLRMILEIDILRYRGVHTDIIFKKVRQAESLSKKYELAGEMILINEIKQQVVVLSKGLSNYKKTIAENLESLNDVKLKTDALDFFRKLTVPTLFSANKESNYTDLAKESTEQLRILSQKNPSSQIRALYLRSEVFYNHLINDYNSAEKFAFEFLDFVTSNRVLNASDNMGGGMMMISTISVYLHNYDNAIKFAIEAMPYFHAGSNNQVNLSELLFFCYLRKEDFNQTLELVDKISLLKTVKKNQFLKSKWQYFKANLFFQQGHYNEALSILQKQSDLLSDKSGWRLGFKIMEMMCIIEMDTCDWLDYRIETFRKLLSTVKNENIHRPKLILHIIKQFIKHAYDIKLTNKKCEEQLNLLRMGEGDYRYDPRGYEVIRFDKWWDAKLSKKLQRN